MRLTPAVRGLIALGLVLPPVTSVGQGQLVRGTVLDSATSTPLEACWVSLLDRGDQIVARVLTDSGGQFVLTAVTPGNYRVRFDRIGYRAVRSEVLALGARSEIELSVQLPPGAVGLEPLTVTAAPDAAARYLDKVGYFERKGTAPGVYLDGPELEERRRRARDLSDILRGVPGVSHLALAGGSSIDNRSFRLRGMDSMQRPCRLPLMYVDGMQVTASDLPSLNAVLLPEQILAIEVYRGPSEVPSAYSSAESGCGVMLIWTQR